MRVLHCVPSLDPRHGGPSQTVVALADALARTGELRVALLAQGAVGRPVVPGAVGSAVARRVLIGRARWALALGLPMRRGLAEVAAAARPALIHSHGVWHPAGHWAARAARRWRVPLILHPRGMLEPWALGQKAWKKRLALAAFQRRDLHQARVLVATSALECENLRALGLRQPVAVIPNGVVLPAGEDTGAPAAGLQAKRERLALFLSRVHPKKGVLELVRAWAQVAPSGWRLVIAGPDEGGHAAAVARLVADLGLNASVELAGAVAGAQKAALYRSADLFVLPTFSENFGLVVAEALSFGVPVITTRGAPWADLETHGCGWWIDTGVAPLVEALRAATALSDAERQAMGERGRVYVQRYDWNRIAEQTLALYRWVLGQGERPACVRVD
jgi:glycosyltransferase involved in cell wall biosynthesis